MELLKINYLFGWLESHRSVAEIRKKKKETIAQQTVRGRGAVRTEKSVRKNMTELQPFSVLLLILI